MRAASWLVGCVAVLGVHGPAAVPSGRVEQLCREGRHVEAERIAAASLAGNRERNPRHPRCAASLHNLAVVYVAQGRCSEAKVLYQQALAVDEDAGQAPHAGTATTLSNLAAVYRDQEQFSEAESLLRRALGIREALNGPDHHWTAAVLLNLAMTYDCQGRKHEAASTHERALAILRKVVAAAGADPPTSLEPAPVFRWEQVEPVGGAGMRDAGQEERRP